MGFGILMVVFIYFIIYKRYREKNMACIHVCILWLFAQKISAILILEFQHNKNDIIMNKYMLIKSCNIRLVNIL